MMKATWQWKWFGMPIRLALLPVPGISTLFACRILDRFWGEDDCVSLLEGFKILLNFVWTGDF